MDQEALNIGIRILRDQIQSGQIQFASGLSVVESLKNVKNLPNGDVDPNSVDGSVRSLIKVTSFFHHREQLKEISLHEIQSLYFELLEKNFSGPYELMLKTNSTPHMVASFISEKKPDLVKEITEMSPRLNEVITKFWQTLGPSVEVHLQDLNGLKSIYGGDIFPSYNQGIISRTGLYVDTIVLPDPVLRGLSFYGTMIPEKAVYYLIKHCVSALSLKNIILADVNPPIAVIAKDYVPIDKESTDFLISLSMKDTVTHLNKAFGLNFTTEHDVDKFLSQIKKIDDLQDRLKQPERIVNDLEWKDLPIEKQNSESEKLRSTMPGYSKLGLGEKVKFDAFGRMMQANELIYKANQLHGIPTIDAPTSWQYLLWKYEYDKEHSKRVNSELSNTLIVNSLQHNRLSWLGNVPNEALIRLRKGGALSELRTIFSKDIKAIELADNNQYDEIVNEIISNINQKFYIHMAELKKHTGKSSKYFGYEIAPWLINGGISIAAASTGNIPLSIMSATIGIVGISSAKDLWLEGKKLLSEKGSLLRSPVGILFDAHSKANK